MDQDARFGGGPAGAARLAFRVAVVLVGILAFVPVADLIPGEPGSNMPPPLWALFLLWAFGALLLGLAARLAVKLLPGKADPRPSPRLGAADLLEGRWAPVLLLVALPTFLYSFVAWEVFAAAPLHIDSMTQAFQARILAEGGLSVPAPADSRFFSSFLIVELGDRAFAHFPPGWAAILVVGLLLKVPWVVAPLCGALAAWGLFLLLRENGESGRTALLTALLFALAPWVVFNAASWMNHTPAVCFIVLGSYALLRGIHSPTSWIWPGLGAASLGMAVLIRPMDGVAFGLPATVWVVARGLKDPAARRGLASFALGGVLAVGLHLAYNWAQHGNPLIFGFEAQWGAGHGLGFHEAPWGPSHTLLRGVELLNGYLLALQMLFFDAPAPSLLPALAALLLVRRLDALDRYLLAGSGLILLGYLSYWGEGHYLGPRYLLPLAPVVAIWTARLGRVLGDRTGRLLWKRWAHAFVVLLLVGGWAFGTPDRWAFYRQIYPLRRLDTLVLSTPRAQRALVLVPSAWSSQVEARIWATGMPRLQAQWLTDRISLCRLELALASLEREGVTDPAAVAARLVPLAADSASMARDPLSGAPGDPYAGLDREEAEAASLCHLRQALEGEHTGFLLLPLLARLGPTWTGDGPIVARDLQEGNRRILLAYPDREVFFLRPLRLRGTVRQLGLEPLRVDSAEAVWRALDSLKAEAAARWEQGAGGP